jgi:hypothetical protein
LKNTFRCNLKHFSWLPYFNDLVYIYIHIYILLSFIGVTFSCSRDSFHPKYKKRGQNIPTLRGQNTDFLSYCYRTGTRYLYFIEIQLRFLCPVVRYTGKLSAYRVPHSTRTHSLLFMAMTNATSLVYILLLTLVLWYRLDKVRSSQKMVCL